MVWLVGARAEVYIATAGSFSGPTMFRGEQMQHGANLAVEHINARGGVLGHKVRLLFEDDACNPEQAVAVANKLVADGVVFVAGHNCSSGFLPPKSTRRRGILMISPASTNPGLTDEGGSNVFRVCGRDDFQGVIASNYLADVWSDARIAILHDGQAYGKDLAAITKKQLNHRGVQEVLFDSYTPGERDYFELVTKLRAADIEVVYVGGYAAEAALMLRQARDEGYKFQLVRRERPGPSWRTLHRSWQ